MRRREDAPPPGFINQSLPALISQRDPAESERASEMTTGCVRSTLEPEHRPVTQESAHYQEVLESLEEVKSEIKGDEEEQQEKQEDQLKKPRRKDTPVLNSPPHVPGVRRLKAEKQMVFLEDEETDGKD